MRRAAAFARKWESIATWSKYSASSIAQMLASGLVEHEYDHVFFGRHEGCPILDPGEADDWRWMDMAKLNADVRKRPEAYSFWLAASLDQVDATVRRWPEIWRA